jgi:hypothetical protein
MIAKIMKASRSFQAVYYNEHKISEQKAELMVAANFNQQGFIRGVGEMNKRDYIAYFTAVSQMNEHVKNRQFHAVISAKGQSHTAQELTAIAEEYLHRMGYGQNPYLIYFHQDTDNNHVHIVSSRVNTEGVKVKDSFEKRASLRHIEEIMAQIPQQALNSTAIATRLLDYDFQSEAQLKTLAERLGYKTEQDGKGDWYILKVQEGQKRQVAQIGEDKIKAKITTSQDPKAQAQREKRISQLKAILIKYKEQKANMGELEAYMKEKFGVELVFHQSAGHDKPFGYTLIDHAEKRVIKGSEVMKLKVLLGDSESHVSRLEKLVKAEKEKQTTKQDSPIEGLQNYLDSHDLHLVLKNGAPHLVDELNGEVHDLSAKTDLKEMLQSTGGREIYTTDLDKVVSVQAVSEQGLVNLLPMGDSEDERRRKRKQQQSYGY